MSQSLAALLVLGATLGRAETVLLSKSELSSSNLLHLAREALHGRELWQVVFQEPSCGKPPSREIDASSYREWISKTRKTARPTCGRADVLFLPGASLLRTIIDGKAVTQATADDLSLQQLMAQVSHFQVGGGSKHLRLFFRVPSGDLTLGKVEAAFHRIETLLPGTILELFFRTDDCFGDELSYPVVNPFGDHSHCPISKTALRAGFACYSRDRRACGEWR